MQQQTALEILKEGHSVFLTGAPGTGKTHVLKEYISYVRSHQIAASVTASTGIAASHIQGITLHSFAGLGITDNLSEKDLKNILTKGHIVSRIRKTRILIIDEISMVSPAIFEAVDQILKRVHVSEKPFGGIQILMSGDFFQLPPVTKKPQKKKYIWQTTLWEELDPVICYLHENFRQEDHNFIEILNEIRAGEISDVSQKSLEECIHRKMSTKESVRLYTHNIDVDRINQQELAKLKTPARAFRAGGKGKKTVIDSILSSTLVMPVCTVKIGALVIFIKNNPESGYVNGTMGKVIDYAPQTHYPIILTVQGEKITAQPEEWVKEDEKGKTIGGVRQVPLRLAWALTIHKSQGMTIDSCEVDLSKSFEVGQGYVALSRVRSLEGLRILGTNENALRIDNGVKNFDSTIKEASDFFERDFVEVNKKKHEDKKTQFIITNGGVLTVKKHVMQRQDRKKNTIEKTKELLETGITIDEIAAIRNVKIETIISHCNVLITQGIDITTTQVNINNKSLKKILKVCENHEKNSIIENTEEAKMISKKEIFDRCDGEISYDVIRRGLLIHRQKK